MAFPKALLAEHEKLVFDLKPHWVSILPSVLWTLFLIAAGTFASVFAGRQIDDPDTESTVQLVILGLALLAWILLALVPYLKWLFTRFVLTSDRLITRSGVLAKHSKEIPLERINDVAFSQTVVERMLGAGDLLIESAGERGQTVIGNVRKPEQVQLMIYKETEANNTRMFTPGTAAAGHPSQGGPRPQPTVPEQIEALARLKEQGVLSDSEFQTKKQELLKRL